MLDNLTRDTKTLRNTARAIDRAEDARRLALVINHLDAAQSILGDPTLFHPTLF